MDAISARNLNFDFGGDPVLIGVDLAIPPGSRCLLVGANGAGKSSLLKVLAVRDMRVSSYAKRGAT